VGGLFTSSGQPISGVADMRAMQPTGREARDGLPVVVAPTGAAFQAPDSATWIMLRTSPSLAAEWWLCLGPSSAGGWRGRKQCGGPPEGKALPGPGLPPKEEAPALVQAPGTLLKGY
jgi:hypothetical protein